MSHLWIPTPEQEAEIQSRIATACALVRLGDAMTAAEVASASPKHKAAAVAKVLVRALEPIVEVFPLAEAFLAELPGLIDELAK